MTGKHEKAEARRGGRPGALFLAGAAAAGGWMAYSALRINHNVDLPPALDAERRTFASPTAGILSYYVDRHVEGRPLVLVHAINAAGGSHEMRPLFDHYRALRPVYALDLPGFGFSDRSNRVYSPEIYRDAILDLVRSQVKEPEAVDVIALSLGSEFAAMAALAEPERFASLVLISPTGLSERTQRNAIQKSDMYGYGGVLHSILSAPIWSQAIYDLIASRLSLRYFLRQSFEGDVPEAWIDYAYLTSHRPGARYAPLYFISGKLFTLDALESIYEKIAQPVLVLYDYDPFTSFEELPGLLQRRPNWHAERILPTRGLPHWEQREQTIAALERFWARR